ncbi:MAG TPA: hypothetical protein VJX74_02035 [Blastocatellia bacterium]|nr:hypothetical protein [Blastocatellia bacterium]
MPTSISDPFLDDLLSGDERLASLVPGGWHDMRADQDATGRLGIYRYMSCSLRFCSDTLPRWGMNPLAWVDVKYLLVVADEGARYEDLSPAVNRVDELLATAKPRELEGGAVLWTRYGGVYRRGYPLPGGPYVRELGAFWVVAVRDNILCG